MEISPGTRLGPYEVKKKIGAGGMGEVYSAQDTRLDRIVAVKILPSHLSANPDLCRRFEREARSISKLSHPNICSLFDVGNEDGVEYLVMEYIEGETLAERLARGPLPLDDVIRTATEIAEALDSAHGLGFLHRDLKPGNVMLSKSGAKLLDFGLAKHSGFGDSSADLTATPTIASPLTAKGTIMGTFQYMAPELLDGGEADKRSDVFAFGATLYEMVTGKIAFEGKTQASVIAGILEREPEPVTTFNAKVPPRLERLIRSCLEKKPDDRRSSMTDIVLELRGILKGPGKGGAPHGASETSRRGGRTGWIVAAVFALLAAGLGTLLAMRPAPEARVVFSYLPPPPGTGYNLESNNPGPAAISPDGRMIAFTAMDEKGDVLLWVRHLDSPVAQPLHGTDGALYPFWSPDSRHIAFFADQKLKKIAALGGPPLTLCDAVFGKSGSWGESGSILFPPTYDTGIHMVSAAGGEATVVTELDSTFDENSHRFPQWLPDGEHFLYLSRRGGGDGLEGVLMLGTVGGESRELMPIESQAQYVSGHLLFLREQTLMARPFDASSLGFSGEAFPITESVEYITGAVYGVFAASENGTLLFQKDSREAQYELVWYDRSGAEIGTIREQALYARPRISPSGEYVAVEIPDPESSKDDIWIIELDRDVKTRFTFNAEPDFGPVWSPDSEELIYVAQEEGSFILKRKAVHGSSEAVEIWRNGSGFLPICWSSDGQLITISRDADIWTLSLEEGAEPERYTHTEETREFSPHISPDGRWLLYQSDETGDWQIYVTTFPEKGRKWQVSIDPAFAPLWSKNGAEIMFTEVENSGLMAVSVDRNGRNLQVGRPVHLMDIAMAVDGHVPLDGERILLCNRTEPPEIVPLTLVLNWLENHKDR